MPMVRYRIRNEYGLADPELYQSADRDDPEALLEGVAMAGLVGVLRQLGDLAEFAAEIFHDLHEEVMATAARGHGLMLRVQQVEEEFPTVEKAFLSQTSHSHFSFNTGVDWHPILRMDQNLLTQGDMPRFILDSYEECHGPPRLFTLDKFDIAGAGACLKRYSDPSFFKVNLASSSLVEGDFQREKKARKIKKKGSRWRNGETLESLLAPHMDSNSQPETADQASEKIQTRRVKLKYRNLNAPDTGRSFMEKIFEVQSAKQQTLSENSINRSHTKMKSVDSCESIPEEHEIVVDPSAQSPLFSVRNPAQSSAKQEETELSTNESKKHKRVTAELSETLPDLIVKTPNTYSSLPTGKLEEMSTKAENVISLNGYRSGEVEESPSALQEVDQMELLTYDDGRQGGPDCSRSDDVASDLENFMDALNTMESEAETDSESRVKSDLGFMNVDSQGMDSNTREGQLELQAQISETVTVENSTKLVGLDSSIKEGLSSVSDSDTLGSLAGPATPLGDMAALSLQANSEICLSERDDETSEENLNDGEDEEIRSLAVSVGGSSRNSENLWEDGEMFRGDLTAYNLQVDSEACLSESNSKTPEELLNDNKDKQIKILEVSTSETNDRTSENLCEVGEELDLDPSDYFPCNGTSNANASDISFRRSETGYLSSSSCVTDLASHLIHLCPQGMSDENQVINSTTNGTVSEYSTHEDTEHLYGDQRTTGTSEPPSLANDEMLIPSTDENYERYSVEYAEERISDVATGTPDIPGHFLQTKDTNILDLDDAALSSSMPEGEPEAPVKQDTEAISSECISPIITASVANGSSIVQSDRLAVKMENVAAPMEDLTKSESATSLENADDFVESKISVSKVLSLESEHYSEAEELEEHCNVKFTDLAPLSVQREPFPSSMLLESNASDISVTDGPISIRDNLEPSYESMAIDHLTNEVQIGLTESDSLVTEKVTIEAQKGDEHDPCSIYSPEEEPGPHIHSQEDFVPCETALNVQKLETDEISGLKEIIALSSESMQNMSLSPQNDDQLLSAPTNSCSESLVPDSDNSSDAKFLYSLPSEHALENFELETGKESQVLSLESVQDFSSKTHLQCSPKNAQEDMSSPTHLLTKPAASFEETAETQDGNELELKSLQEAEEDYEHLVPYDLRCERVHPIGETSVLNNSLDLVHRESEPKPHEFVSNGKTSELETAPSSYLEPEIAISLESTSEACVSSLASNMAMAPSGSLDFGLARLETNPPESSEPQLDESLPSSPIQDFTETPPLPPLPPLQWRMGKLQLGSQLSDGNAMQPPIGSNLFTVAPTAGQEHLHSSISLGDEWVQPEDLSTHLPALEENLQSSFVAERKMVQPLRFSELPPIVEDKEHQNGIIVSEGEMMHPIHPPSVAPPIEDGKQFYSHNELRGHMVHPSNPFAQLPALEDDISQHLPACNLQNMQSVNLSVLPQISDKERPLLGQVPPNLEANRPQHGAPSLEKDYVQPLSQYWAVSTAEYAIHQYNYGVNGGENVLSSNMLVPLPTTGPMIPPHGSASFTGQNPFAPYDVIEPSTEDEKPYRKRSSILNRPRDPLIEAVASHDKSTLRKVSEMVKPPTRPKEGERDTLLDQIRNKSFNLKPAVVKRPSMKGPPTNLKVAAILEKANSIRQACVGSDEDDDGDSWSDS